MSAARASVISALWEMYEFDPSSRPPDKEHGCGQIWELEHPPNAVFSLAYCRMKGPSEPHANSSVAELYVPTTGRARVCTMDCREGVPLDRDSGPLFVPVEEPHALIPVTPVFACYLVTVPPYPKRNRMVPAQDGINGWSDRFWLEELRQVAHERGTPLKPLTDQITSQIDDLVRELTV